MKDGRQSKCKACTSKWHYDNRERRLEIRMKSVYGIDAQQYKTLLENQKGLCAICGTARPETPSGTWCIDHDHVTGEIRGLLCFLCNSGLGHFRDRIDLIENAKAYLVNPPAHKTGIRGKIDADPASVQV